MSNDHFHAPRATKVQGRGHWTGEAADSVLLDFEDRHQRRLHMVGVGGLQFLLDLPEALHLRGGDALELEDGRLIEVVAAPERLVEVRAADPQVLARLAWHIGNRHVPVEITRSALRIRADQGLEAALEGMGAKLRPIETAFEPEGGAYAPEGHAKHDHHDHGHDHHDHHDHDHHDHDHNDHDHHDHDHHDHQGHEHPHK